MKVIVFGATGMIGQSVLRECLLDPDVEGVVTLGRRPSGQRSLKLSEIVHQDLHDYSLIESQLRGLDACFYCLGVTSSGMSESEYSRVTYDLTVAAARALVKQNPDMTFIFISGSGTDSSEQGRVMWARVKGRAENAVFATPFKASYAFRPAFVEARHGVVSSTRSYRILYFFLKPLVPLLRLLLPRYVTSSVHIGRAMLEVSKHGSDKQILESPDIEALGQRSVAARPDTDSAPI